MIAFVACSLLFGNSISVKAEDEDSLYATELLKAGQTAPDFTLTDINGTNISLSQFKGKYVVLDFWASWCPDCRKDIPNIIKAYNEFKDKGVIFIGVSFDTKKDVWSKTVSQYGMAYYQVSELKKWHDTKISGLYNLKWIPSMYLIGPDGKVVLSTVMSDRLAAKLRDVTK